MNKMTFDSLIIGGGIIGSSIAYELAKKGQSVLLLEKNEFGAGASGCSAAMLECQVDSLRGNPFLSLARASNRLFPTLYEEVKSLTGLDFQYERCGIAEIARDNDNRDRLIAELKRQKRLGLNARWLNQEELHQRYPHLDVEFLGGILFEEDGQVNGEKYLNGMIRAAERSGALLIEKAGPIEIQKESDTLFRVSHLHGEQRGHNLILACGAWTDELTERFGVPLGIKPLKGQLIIYDSPKTELKTPLYTRTHGYLAPKRDGYVLGGTTVESVGFDQNPTERAKAFLHQQALKICPGFSRLPVRGVTAGVRPGTPDDLPYIGPLPEEEHLFVAAGHFRNGILLSPITAKIIAAMITGRPLPADLTAFSPSRAPALN